MIRRVSPKDYTEQCDVVDGFHTGLWLPNKRPEVYPSVSEVVPTLDAESVKRFCASPEMSSPLLRFPPKKMMRNQGQHNSCAGYAAAQALTQTRVAVGLPYVQLSGEFIYSLCNGGRDRGAPTELTWQKMEEVGIAPESMVEHGSYLWRQMSESARKAAEGFKGWGCHRVDSLLELATAIINGFICVVVVHVSRSYRQLDSRGVRGRSPGRGNHAVIVNGIRISPTGKIEFLEWGSWGLENGIDGCAHITWDGHLEGPVQRHAFYAVSNASGSLAA
jgi:hypothetical protein